MEVIVVPVFPRWIWPWAGVLALMAGFVNAVAILATHEAATHLTGVATAATAAVALGNWPVAAILGLVALAFVIGAAMSGVLLRAPRWQSMRHVCVPFFLEAASLVVGGLLLDSYPTTGLTLCAFAVGIQNGTSTITTGALIRTSHVTGILTDLAVSLGQALQGRPWDRRRASVCGIVFGGFVIGALAGAWGFHRWGGLALLCPAGVAALVGLWHVHPKFAHAHIASATAQHGE
ncbi:YoaK family protein [Pinirhizobacter soli]|uniref:YoaK family protein n=1 Tax=Pinirhizobacter soli TaxID=2786953 RepID=UPI00202A276B